jgi:hypothetical protein
VEFDEAAIITASLTLNMAAVFSNLEMSLNEGL